MLAVFVFFFLFLVKGRKERIRGREKREGEEIIDIEQEVTLQPLSDNFCGAAISLVLILGLVPADNDPGQDVGN